MKNRIRLNAKIWKIVPVALLTIMLFSTIAFAEVDVQINQQDDSVKLVVTNVGKSPTYILNALTLLNEKGNPIYTSQELSSAEVLKINPGISYAFEWDTEGAPEGRYIGKIYQGDNKGSLRAKSINFQIGKRPGKPILYTDKKIYKPGKKIDVTFKNMGLGTIYVNVNNWEIINLDTGKVVFTLSQDCTFGYRGCADSFEPLRFMKDIEQTWDQKDTKGNQVAPGSYIVTAEYSNTDPSSGRFDIKTVSTKKFFIRSLRNDNREDKT